MKYVLGKKAILYSVPGTATRFTKKLLEECFGYTSIGVKAILGKPVRSRYLTFHHVDAEAWRKYTEKRGDLRAVIPLRSPVAQYITRRKDLGGGWKARNRCQGYWQMLKDSLHLYNHIFLPVEEDFDREALIWRVAEHLEMLPNADALKYFVKEWPKVGTSGPKPEREEYDTNGKVTIEGQPMEFLAKEMAWYRSQIEKYRKEVYQPAVCA